ncbi:hypothetical protein BW41_03362 [Sphingomonas sp. RIT328]|nr:hypothetical protein BW41_03362 [Sphingomonas sp. RIT328]
MPEASDTDMAAYEFGSMTLAAFGGYHEQTVKDHRRIRHAHDAPESVVAPRGLRARL